MTFRFFRKYQKPVIIGLTVFTAVTFTVTGSLYTLFSDEPAATIPYAGRFTLVGGETVEVSMQEFYAWNRALQLRYRKPTAQDIWVHIMIYHQAVASGITASDEQIAEGIRRFFAGVSRQDYQTYVRRAGYRNAKEFEEWQRRFQVIALFRELNDHSAFVLEEQIYNRFKLDNQEYQLAYVSVSWAALKEEVEKDVPEEELQAFYEGMPEGDKRTKFRVDARLQPQILHVTYADLDLEKEPYATLSSGKLAASEEDLRTFYEENRVLLYRREVEESGEDTKKGSAPGGEETEETGQETGDEEEREPREEGDEPGGEEAAGGGSEEGTAGEEAEGEAGNEQGGVEEDPYEPFEKVSGDVRRRVFARRLLEAAVEELRRDEPPSPDDVASRYGLARFEVEEPKDRIALMDALEPIGARDTVFTLFSAHHEGSGTWHPEVIATEGGLMIFSVVRFEPQRTLEFDEADREAVVEAYVASKAKEMALAKIERFYEALDEKATPDAESELAAPSLPEEAERLAATVLSGEADLSEERREERRKEEVEKQLDKLRRRVLAKHYEPYFNEVAAAEGLEVHETIRFRGRVTRTRMYQEMEGGPEKYLLGSLFAATLRGMQKGEVTPEPVLDYTNENVYVVLVKERRDPDPESMTPRERQEALSGRLSMMSDVHRVQKWSYPLLKGFFQLDEYMTEDGQKRITEPES